MTKLWKRVQFGNGEMLDLAELRFKIAASTSSLTLFLNLLSIGSQGKVESYMESHGDDLKDMRRSLNWITASMQAKAPKAREGSILTTYAGDDKAIWKDFRRELIKEGFSSEILQRHKETIKDYVMELGSRGALDDIGDGGDSGDSDSAILLRNDGTQNETKNDSTEDSKLKLEKMSKEKSEEKPDGNHERDPEPTLEGDSEHSNQRAVNDPKQQTEDAGENQHSIEDHVFLDQSLELSADAAGLSDYNGPPAMDRQEEDDEDDVASFKELSSPDEERLTSKNTCSGATSHAAHTSLSPEQELNPLSDTQRRGKSPLNTLSIDLSSSKTEHTPPAVLNRIQDGQNSIPYPNTFKVPADVWLDMETALKWFGLYRDHMVRSSPWHLSLRFHTTRPLWKYTNSGPETSFHSPHLICSWMLSSARLYDDAQIAANCSPKPPNRLSPLVDELLRLLARGCAYCARPRYCGVSSAQTEKYIDDFRRILLEFYHLIGVGISFMLFCNREQWTSTPTLWKLDGYLRWKSWNYGFVIEQPAINGLQTTRSIYELEPQASMDLVCGLFEDEEVVWSRHRVVRRFPLADFIPKVQNFLLYFKRWCEDDLLEAESRRSPHTLRAPHHIQDHEMRDKGVVDAVYELKMCKVALETWSFQNDYCKDDLVKTGRFARSESSLSAILERYDNAQEKLYRAREKYYIPLGIINLTKNPSAIPDKPRPEKKNTKKKK
jgi:hypothetical protein